MPTFLTGDHGCQLDSFGWNPITGETKRPNEPSELHMKFNIEKDGEIALVNRSDARFFADGIVTVLCEADAFNNKTGRG